MHACRPVYVIMLLVYVYSAAILESNLDQGQPGKQVRFLKMVENIFDYIWCCVADPCSAVPNLMNRLALHDSFFFTAKGLDFKNGSSGRKCMTITQLAKKAFCACTFVFKCIS